MGDGFPLRHRGAHLPDHVRHLELLTSSTRTIGENGDRTPRSSPFRPLALPEFAHDFLRRCGPLEASTHSSSTGSIASIDSANVFANLSAWVDASLRKCVYHAGFDKIRIYALFLECFLDEVAPQNELIHHRMQELQAYIQYLSARCDDTTPNSCPSRRSRAKAGSVTNALTPRQLAGLRTDRLSSKANSQAAVLVPHMLQQLSPRAAAPAPSPRVVGGIVQVGSSGNSPQRPLTYPKRKRIVQMSNHEERILELALFFDETLRAKLTHISDSSQAAAIEKGRGNAEFTTQWAVLPSDARDRVLRKYKKRLARQSFFPCSAALQATASHASAGYGGGQSITTPRDELDAIVTLLATAGSGKSGGGDDTTVSSASASLASTHRLNHKMALASYFSLVLLCLHESVRRVGTFSLELAAFAKKLLCEDTLTLCEDMFASILAAQTSAQQQLLGLKHAKAALQQQIRDTESEIVRLQTQNMRSLTMCSLEKRELEHLEREEQWHGHCKALIVGCVNELRDAVSTPTWLRLGTPTPLHSSNAGELTGSAAPAAASVSPDLHRHEDYQRLAPGFALFDFQSRIQVVYIAHLVQLCRSFLHLHERRGVHDVMSSTAITSAGSENDTVAAHTTVQSAVSQGDDWLHGDPSSFFNNNSTNNTNNPMEKISLSELHTLREIDDALRAVEVLYAETGTSSGSTPSAHVELGAGRLSPPKHALRRLRPPTHSVSTQFPRVGVSIARSYLRSLAYCTMAANAFAPLSTAMSSSSLPLKMSPRHPADLETETETETETVMGSGRRSSSVRFRVVAASSATLHSLPHSQPQIRLSKALLKLPRHIKELLILDLVQTDESASPAESLSTCLTVREIVDKIHWIYRIALDSVFGSSPATSDSLPVSLADHLTTDRFASWSSPHFVDFIYAGFLDAEAGDVAACEREFVRFFASVQLVLTHASPASAVASGTIAGASGVPPSGGASGRVTSSGSDAITLFALLVQLLRLQPSDLVNGGLRPQLPPRVFPVVFYVQRVLLHVAVTKKQIETSGFARDVWVLAADESSAWGRAAKPSPRAPTTTDDALFVLLESVKVLLLHVVAFAFAADVGALLEAKYQLLLEKATVTTVALLTPVTPGLYTLTTSSTATSSSGPNGQLADVHVVPMDLAVATIVRTWVHVHSTVEHSLGLTLQGTLSDAHGCIAFDEFAHVMTAHSSATQQTAHHQPHSNSSLALSSVRLAHIYACAQARASTSRDDAPHWTTLLAAVVETVDVMGVHDRFRSVDFRSIQHALLAPGNASSSKALGGALASSWLLGSTSRGGATTTHALVKSWRLHRQAMRDHVTLAFQAERALEGVRCWQTGSLRLRRLEQLLHNTTTVAVGGRELEAGVELPPDALCAAWKAYQLLQWDHARAHQFADHVRRKQQQSSCSDASLSLSADRVDAKEDEGRPLVSRAPSPVLRRRR